MYITRGTRERNSSLFQLRSITARQMLARFIFQSSRNCPLGLFSSTLRERETKNKRERKREGERGEWTTFRHVQLRRRVGMNARSLSLPERFYLAGGPRDVIFLGRLQRASPDFLDVKGVSCLSRQRRIHSCGILCAVHSPPTCVAFCGDCWRNEQCHISEKNDCAASRLRRGFSLQIKS
jgi:hypothetical protein